MTIKHDQPEAAAQRSGSGFMESRAGPKPPQSLQIGPAGLGLYRAWPGLAHGLRPGRNSPSTKAERCGRAARENIACRLVDIGEKVRVVGVLVLVLVYEFDLKALAD
jgi:hypothetical protein